MTKLEKIIGPLPGEKEARAFGVAGIGVALIACFLSLYFGFQGETFMGRPMGSDFVQFYSVGKILNEQPAARIFDVPFLTETEHQSLPTMSSTQMLIFGSAPCVAALFRPFALLTYNQAYCVWLILSAALYFAGLMLVNQGNSTALLIALSAPMFTLETWIGGQISIFAFLAFAACVRWFEEKRFFLAGLALGLAAYKPSLIAIPALLLIFGRQWRMLLGLCVSASAIFLASLATVGWSGMDLWFRTLRAFRYLAMDEESILKRSKYVDLNSFLNGLFGSSKTVIAVAFVLVALAMLRLIWIWFRSRDESLPLLWAATIASTLLLSVYVPVYDTIVLVPALILTSRNLSTDGDRHDFRIWILLFCLVPWLTQAAADFLRIQILTIVLAGFSYWILRMQSRNVAR
jgi:hypothetical protein